jgi:hypothetical protein
MKKTPEPAAESAGRDCLSADGLSDKPSAASTPFEEDPNRFQLIDEMIHLLSKVQEQTGRLLEKEPPNRAGSILNLWARLDLISSKILGNLGVIFWARAEGLKETELIASWHRIKDECKFIAARENEIIFVPDFHSRSERFNMGSDGRKNMIRNLKTMVSDCSEILDDHSDPMGLTIFDAIVDLYSVTGLVLKATRNCIEATRRPIATKQYDFSPVTEEEIGLDRLREKVISLRNSD